MDVFGVEMSGGVAAKIIDTRKFLNWSFWWHLTPLFASTVFARPAIHIAVFSYMAMGNIAFFLHVLRGANAWEPFGLGLSGLDAKFLAFVVSAFMTTIITRYHTATREKAAGYFRGTESFVNTISTVIDYKAPRAKETLISLHNATNAMGYYAFALASARTKFRKSKEKICDIFEDRDLDGDYLLSVHKKETVSILRRGMIQTLHEEWQCEDGCLRGLDAYRWEGLLKHLQTMSGSAMSLISCVSSNKLPFAYIHLASWGTSTLSFSFTLFLFLEYAQEVRYASEDDGLTLPFSCGFDGTCGTEYFILFNASQACKLYVIFGILELYRCMGDIWESGFVLKSYLSVVDMVCDPLLPRNFPPRNLNQMKSKNAHCQLRYLYQTKSKRLKETNFSIGEPKQYLSRHPWDEVHTRSVRRASAA
jgi:hypothetical protein